MDGLIGGWMDRGTQKALVLNGVLTWDRPTLWIFERRFLRQAPATTTIRQV